MFKRTSAGDLVPNLIKAHYTALAKQCRSIVQAEGVSTMQFYKNIIVQAKIPDTHKELAMATLMRSYKRWSKQDKPKRPHKKPIRHIAIAEVKKLGK